MTEHWVAIYSNQKEIKGAVINYWGERVGIISKVRAQKC